MIAGAPPSSRESVTVAHHLGPVRDARQRATCVCDTVDALERYPFAAGARPPQQSSAPVARSALGRALSIRCRQCNWDLIAGSYHGTPSDLVAITNTLDRGGAVVGDLPLRPAIAASFDSGVIPLALQERPWQVGRHCVVIVGYCTDLRDVLDPVTRTPVTAALRIRNNWGAQWGAHGCGWLPFGLVRCGVLGDIWHIYEPEDA